MAVASIRTASAMVRSVMARPAVRKTIEIDERTGYSLPR
jgi:hypothetical protein